MTTTNATVLELMEAHHASLVDGAQTRIDALAAAVRGPGTHAEAAADLITYLAGEVLPHAEAEEHSVYRAASSRADLAPTIVTLEDEHRRLAAAIEQLARAREGNAIASAAAAVGELFISHVARENEFVLAPLASDPGVDLGELLREMQHFLSTAAPTASTAGDRASGETAALVSLLLEAARALAEEGRTTRRAV